LVRVNYEAGNRRVGDRLAPVMIVFDGILQGPRAWGAWGGNRMLCQCHRLPQTDATISKELEHDFVQTSFCRPFREISPPVPVMPVPATPLRKLTASKPSKLFSGVGGRLTETGVLRPPQRLIPVMLDIGAVGVGDGRRGVIGPGMFWVSPMGTPAGDRHTDIVQVSRAGVNVLHRVNQRTSQQWRNCHVMHHEHL